MIVSDCIIFSKFADIFALRQAHKSKAHIKTDRFRIETQHIRH